MAGAIKHADVDVARLHALGGGNGLDVLGRRLVEIDDAFGIARAACQLVHVDVRCVEQATFFGNGQDGERVRAVLGGDGGAFERIERDVDLRTLARRSADLLADVEHRRLVALTLADDHGAVHVKLVEGGTHGFDCGCVGGLFVAPADKA